MRLTRVPEGRIDPQGEDDLLSTASGKRQTSNEIKSPHWEEDIGEVNVAEGGIPERLKVTKGIL